MERPAAMTNRARKRLNPVRHLGRTVGQKHVAACSARPLRWPHSERPEPKLKRGCSKNHEDSIASVDVGSDDGGIGKRRRGANLRKEDGRDIGGSPKRLWRGR